MSQHGSDHSADAMPARDHAPLAGAQGQHLLARDRLHAAAAGSPVDRPPISFWQHFPAADETPTALVDATLGYLEKYRLDLVKLMPSGMYSVTDYGAVPTDPDPISGARGLASGPIKAMADFACLPRAMEKSGALSAQLRVASEVRRAVEIAVPVIDTVFSPLTMAVKLAGLPAREMIETHPRELHRGLERLTADCADFAAEDLKSGIDGFFFAIQWASAGSLTHAQEQEFGARYDAEVLRQLRPTSAVLMLHLHGPTPTFELANQYDVDWVNWEDGETPPSLRDALGMTMRGLAGGITRDPTRLAQSPDEALKTLASAVAATGGRRLLLAPGCVLPQTASAAVLHALRASLDDQLPAPAEPGALPNGA